MARRRLTAKKSLPLSRVYRLLEPGPVVLVTTAQRGRANVMTMSWHTMLEFEPPLVGCVVSDRDFSFAALRATRECVHQHPDRGAGDAVVRLRQLLRARRGQVRGVRPDAAAGQRRSRRR